LHSRQGNYRIYYRIDVFVWWRRIADGDVGLEWQVDDGTYDIIANRWTLERQAYAKYLKGLASIGRPLIILHHRGYDILEHAKGT
jgi:hypothetical protein